MNSKNIGIPRNIKIINNGGSYHNDSTLTSSFTSNYILTLSGFEEDSFRLGETIVQKSGSVEIARAKVTSYRKGSNIILVNDISGIFREKQQIVGLSRGKVATVENISYKCTDFQGQKVEIDRNYVQEKIGHLTKRSDLSKFIL